jgi:photosynthetic reaction center H subunit
MDAVTLVGRIDVAELTFYAFVLFFIALVFYLRREDRREGYPLEHLVTGKVDSAYGPLTASPMKRFRLPFDRGYAVTPTQGREPVEPVGARRFDRFPGAPYVPTGDPLINGVGPAAFAERARWPDLDMEGRLRIVPISTDEHFAISPKDPDLRGMKVIAADGVAVGAITDIWIDRSDRIIRYFDVQLAGGRMAIVPMMMAKVNRRRGVVEVDAISAGQFANSPQLEKVGEMTRYEEERIQAYFGGGYLYGLPSRQEPLI